MGLQEWIESANANCARGKALLGFGSDVWTRDLSSAEADILCAASENGGIGVREDAGFLCPALTNGRAPIFVGSSDFDRSRQWEAFSSLCLRGVVTPLQDGGYQVSEAALNKGRQLLAQRVCE